MAAVAAASAELLIIGWYIFRVLLQVFRYSLQKLAYTVSRTGRHVLGERRQRAPGEAAPTMTTTRDPFPTPLHPSHCGWPRGRRGARREQTLEIWAQATHSDLDQVGTAPSQPRSHGHASRPHHRDPDNYTSQQSGHSSITSRSPESRCSRPDEQQLCACVAGLEGRG
uniref:Uncharacterized protein n=1 Tax=Ovis aries TaxID=9940 RepID=A0AC11CTR8_SHEEP